MTAGTAGYHGANMAIGTTPTERPNNRTTERLLTTLTRFFYSHTHALFNVLLLHLQGRLS
jgi:hypothetical protein